MLRLLTLLGAPGAFVLFDIITIVRARLSRYPKKYAYYDKQTDFSVLIPIFGDISYLKKIDFLAAYGRKVILCTTDCETPEFYADLRHIAQTHGFRIHVSPIKEAARHPSPWRIFKGTLHDTPESKVVAELARDEIMRDSFKAVDTDVCIFLDGDTLSAEPLGILVEVFRQTGLELASVRVLPSRQKSLVEKLQALEYSMAMDVRRLYPWLTSGASMIARTDAIRHIMASHSLFFQGGDIEIGKLGSLMNYKIGHIPFIFYTDAPASFRAWQRQRIAWCAGGFRHAIINFNRHSWRYPLFFLYNTVLIYSFTPLRWWQVVERPYIIPAVITFYWLLLLAFFGRRWRWFYLAYPLYSLYQVMVIVPRGALRYFVMAYRYRNLGIIKLRTGTPEQP